MLGKVMPRPCSTRATAYTRARGLHKQKRGGRPAPTPLDLPRIYDMVFPVPDMTQDGRGSMHKALRLARKFNRSLKERGLGPTLSRSVDYPVLRIKWFLQNRWFRRAWKNNLPPQEIFRQIYRRNFWNDRESVSGAGSTLRYTEPLRRSLPGLFAAFNVKTVFDAPCGDFNWMSDVVQKTGIAYIGADIVPDLITAHQRRFSGSGLEFRVGDITADPFPQADLWLCRDCLFHLSYRDIARALENFAASAVPYIFTTTSTVGPGFTNTDIHTGGFRMIDLFAPPFHFPKSPLLRVNDYVEPHPPREMCLWSREQIAQLLPALKAAIAAQGKDACSQ